MDQYLNRCQAGITLVKALHQFKNNKDVIILALPRGGVPVAYEVAVSLNIPLDVFIVRKLGVPGYHELAMGAISQGGITVLNHDILGEYQVTEQEIEAVIAHERLELERREKVYRGTRPALSLLDKTVILIDDGVATGATITAAIKSIRHQHPRQLIAAVPVAEKSIKLSLASLIDDFVCPLVVESLQSVGAWYDDFSQTEDVEVCELLATANKNLNK